MAAATALPGFGSVSSAPAKQIIPDAGVFAQTTIAGSVQGDSPSLYVPYIGTSAAASIVAEGAAINESDTKPLELAIRTQKVAVLNVFSNESGAQSAASNGNVGGSGIDVVGMLTDGMKKTIIDKANAILWQNPAPTEGKPETAPTGLFNYPGIIQGGNITNTLDPIVDAIASISTNGGAPTGLVMNYGVWAYLLKLRDAEGRLIISPDVANTPTPRIVRPARPPRRHGPGRQNPRQQHRRRVQRHRGHQHRPHRRPVLRARQLRRAPHLPLRLGRPIPRPPRRHHRQQEVRNPP